MARAMTPLALSVAAVVKLRESTAHVIAQDNEPPAIFGESNLVRYALPLPVPVYS